MLSCCGNRAPNPAPQLPGAPQAHANNASLLSSGNSSLKAPEASPKNREEKRFSRADKNKDGKIESEELLGARRKAFAKLDANGNGALSFEEWAAKTIGKFQGADSDHNGILTAAEYATTAPPPPSAKCAVALRRPAWLRPTIEVAATAVAVKGFK